MSAFGGLVLTNRGRNLQALAQIGVELRFTRIGVGDGQLGSSSMLDLITLKNEIKSLEISKLKTLPGGKAVIGGVFTNQDLDQGFYWREIGVFAADPNNPGAEILYCYGNAGNNAEYIPANDGVDIIEKSIDVIAIIGNASNVTAIIDESLIFATVQEVNRKSRIVLALNEPEDMNMGDWWVQIVDELPDNTGAIVIGNMVVSQSTPTEPHLFWGKEE